jgi:hypothetical protein
MAGDTLPFDAAQVMGKPFQLFFRLLFLMTGI